MSFFVVPYTQDKARSFIRSSNLDFFPSLIKPRKFIDTVENLTVFLDKKDNQEIEKIVLKDASNSDNTQIIIAQKGKIINENEKKYLILYNGKIINKNPEKRSTIFDFKETTLNLDKYHTKTTTSAKIQELPSFDILHYLLKIIDNQEKIFFENFNCNENIKKDLTQEFYKRIYLPFYILLISIVVTFLILKSHMNINYKFNKIIVFLIGIFLVVLSEISINLISENNLRNFLVLLFLPTFILISYLTFINKVKISS